MKKILEIAEQLAANLKRFSIEKPHNIRNIAAVFRNQNVSTSCKLNVKNCILRCNGYRLIKSKQFHLPGKKALYDEEASGNIISIDITESPVERQKK